MALKVRYSTVARISGLEAFTRRVPPPADFHTPPEAAVY